MFVDLCFIDWSHYFFIQETLNYPQEAEWTPTLTHYVLENLVAPGLEPGASAYVVMNPDH
jgi:hypothetical protein